MPLKLLKKFEKARPFTDHEAWILFRIAAFAEAFGWSLLITGILCKRFLLHGNDTPVLIAGQTHGTLFIIYLVASLGLYPSLGWSRWSTLLATAASVPPYGSLLFEQLMSQRRKHEQFKAYQGLMAYILAVRHVEA
jgi:integral membrane protein